MPTLLAEPGVRLDGPPTGEPVTFHCQLHCGTPGPDGMNWLAPGQSIWPVTGHPHPTGGVLLDDQVLEWTYPEPSWESRLELKALTFWPPTGSRWDGIWWQSLFTHALNVTPGETVSLAVRGILLTVPPPRAA